MLERQKAFSHAGLFLDWLPGKTGRLSFNLPTALSSLHKDRHSLPCPFSIGRPNGTDNGQIGETHNESAKLVVWTRAGLVRDQQCRLVPGQIVQLPLEKDDQPILKWDQIHQVNEDPEQPRDHSG